MIVTSLAALLLAAAPALDPLATRKAFLACLDDTVIENLDKKTPADDWEKAAIAACKSRQDAWNAATLAADAADKIPAKQSQADFDEQLADFIDNKKDLYGDYLQSNSRPVKR